MRSHNHSLLRKNPRRLDEELDYWRKRAGWFDDDTAMQEYNNAIYDKYYHGNNGSGRSEGGGSGFSGVFRRGSSRSEKAIFIFKIVAIAVCFILCILMFRIITRRFAGSDKKDKKKSSSSRSRSKSRSRSRSRSRRAGADARSSGDYDLMPEEEKSRKSTRSSRSKSRSRSQTRSRSKSRSQTRSSSRKDKASAATEPVLV